MIRVSIRASSPAMRLGLASLLRPYDSLQVIGERADAPGDAQDAREMTEDSAPDVILAQLESHDELAAQDFADEAAGGVPVVLLVRGSFAEWSDGLGKGARAVLPNDATGRQIAAAIEAVAAGLVVLPASEMDGLVPARGAARESPDMLPEALTAREIEVLRSMAEGLGNKEIAARLGISEHTVKFHVASILGKLGAASRTEAVMSGIRHGIVLI